MARNLFEYDKQPTPKSAPRNLFDNSSEKADSPETWAESAGYAPFRVGEDLINAANSTLQNIPGYWNKAKSEVAALPGLITSHPGHALAQGLAGTQEAINNVNHIPVGLAQYANQRLHLIPEAVPNFLNKITPESSEAINYLFGSPRHEGEEILRGATRNIPNLLGAGKVANVLNPLNLTAKSIAKDVLKTRKRNINNYDKRYENLWKEAEGKGFGNALYDIDVDMKTIKKYSPKKGIQGLEDFNSDPTLQNAHNAKSDLLRIKRELDKKITLNTAERAQKAAVENAIDSIKNNMFKEPSGQIHEGMNQKYNAIQEGYRNEVIPYKNKAINEFIRGESSPEELVNSLSRRAFAAKRGKYHPAMKYRKLISNHPYLSIGGAGGIGALLESIFSK